MFLSPNAKHVPPLLTIQLLSSQLTFFLFCVAVLYFFQLKYAIEELYYFEFVFDGLPVRGFIGQLVRL